jgi:hypothetical protein
MNESFGYPDTLRVKDRIADDIPLDMGWGTGSGIMAAFILSAMASLLAAAWHISRSAILCAFSLSTPYRWLVSAFQFSKKCGVSRVDFEK